MTTSTDTHDDGEVHVTPVRHYALAFGALLLLTGATVGAAYVDLGAWADPVALAIATAKAGVVLTVFMHLRRGSSLLTLIALGGLVWLLILIGLTLTDVLTRTGAVGW